MSKSVKKSSSLGHENAKQMITRMRKWGERTQPRPMIIFFNLFQASGHGVKVIFSVCPIIAQAMPNRLRPIEINKQRRKCSGELWW